jgi:hypothetical protein
MPIFVTASVLCSPQTNPDRVSPRKRTGLLLNPSYATPPALAALGTNTMFRVVTDVDNAGQRRVHAEPLVPATRNSSWQYGGNRLHSVDPAFVEFTGGTESIPLYDVQAA